MHGLAEFPFYALAGCFVLAFVVELALNRRPWIVGFATPVIGYVTLILGASAMGIPVDAESAMILLIIFAFATIGSLAGAGAARALRMWIDYLREESRSESEEA
jgi:predicted tellurium resistance membrane protein TerC